MTTRSFHPPVRMLMGPGPSDVNPRILEAMGIESGVADAARRTLAGAA